MAISLGNLFDIDTSNIVLWSDYDADGDGYLSPSEYDAYIQAGGYDAATIPRITEAELDADAYFAVVDTLAIDEQSLISESLDEIETAVNWQGDDVSLVDWFNSLPAEVAGYVFYGASVVSANSGGAFNLNISPATDANGDFTGEFIIDDSPDSDQQILSGIGPGYIGLDPGIRAAIGSLAQNQNRNSAARGELRDKTRFIRDLLSQGYTREEARHIYYEWASGGQEENPNKTLSDSQIDTLYSDYQAGNTPNNVAEAQRLAEEAAEAERIRLAEEAAEAERIRLAEEAAEAERIRLAEEAAEAERIRLAEEAAEAERIRLAEEAAEAERIRLAEEAAEAERIRLAEEAAEAERIRLAEEAAEAERIRLAEEAAEAERIRLAEEAAEAERIRLAEEAAEAERIRLAEEAEAERIAAEEATKNVFASVGYNPSEQEILDNVGKTEQEIKDYVNPRYVTEAEAADAFEAANGYEPSAEEIQEFIGQRSQTQTEQEIKDYVDPRQITVEEVKEWAATNGYEITDEEAKEYATQGTIEDITTESDAIYKEFDENAVTQAELEIIAAEQNFDLANLDEDSLAELVGNNKESDVVKNIDSRATTIDELADIYKNRTGEDLTPEAAEAMLEQANTAIEGELTEEAFEGWVKENVELDILYQVGRMATGVRNVLFGTGPGGRPKTLTEIMEDILDRQAAGPAGMGYPIKVTFDPTQGTWAELKIPVPLPVNGPPIKIPLFDENGRYIGPQTAGELLLGEVDPTTGEVNGVITQVVDGVKQTVGQVTGNVVQIFDAAGEVIRSVPLGMLEEGSWEEGDPNPFDLEDSNGDGTIDPQTDQNGIPIDPETGFPIYEMPEDMDEDDRLALLSDVEAAKEEVLSTLGDQLTTLGFDIEEVKDILSGVEESLVGVATLEDLETLREGIKEDLAVELDNLGVDVNDINETLDGLDNTINSISTQVGLPSREDDPDTEEDESRPATGLFARIEELQKEGVNQTEAINTAIAELAESQNTTKDAILEQLDTTEANLAAGIADLSTELNDRVDKLVAAGEDRATAVDTVLSELSTEIGTTKDDILEQLGTTEANLAADIADLSTELNDRVDELVAAGEDRATAVDTALSELSTEIGTTKDAILEQLGTTEANLAAGIEAVAEDVAGVAEDVAGVAEDVAGVAEDVADVAEQVGDLDTELNTRIDALVDQGATEYEALSGAISSLASDLNTSEENILSAIATSDSDIKALIGTPAIEDDPTTEEDESAPATGLYAEFGPLATKTDVEAVGTSVAELSELVTFYANQGFENDEALSLAISDLSDRLGTTEENLLTSLGETEETILDAVEGVSAQIDETNVNIANLNELIVQYELDGKTRDEALSLALSDLSTDLGITKEEILTNLGETEETILTRIAESEDNTEEYLTYISNIIGIPASEITQEDVDGIVGLLGEEEAITEINNDIRLYDANFDGVINDIDIGLLQGFVDAGVEGVGEIPATGLYGDAARRQLEIQGYIDDSAQITQGLISSEAADTRQLVGQTALFNAMLGAGDATGRRVDVSTPDPARINYIYDFADIFATPQQKGLFPSPYGGPQRAQQQQIAQKRSIMSGPLQIGGMAQGGKVDYDFTDEIMQIMSYGDN